MLVHVSARGMFHASARHLDQTLRGAGSGRAFGLAVQTSVRMLTSYVAVPRSNPCLRLLIPTSCLCGFWEAGVTALVVWFLLSTSETWIELLAPNLGPLAIAVAWEVNQQIGALAVCLSLHLK